MKYSNSQYKFSTTILVSSVFLIVGSYSCKAVYDATNSPASKPSALLKEWEGPYGGVPPWDLVRPSEFSSAFDIAIAEAKKDIEAIANDPEPANFKNTFVAMENAGKKLNRVVSLFGVHSGNLKTGDMPDIVKQQNPKLAAYADSITQNSKLFARIALVNKTASSLPPAEQRLVENTYKNFVREGASLNDKQKARLSEINQELSKYETEFEQNVLNDEQEKVTWVKELAELDGLSPSIISGYAKEAEDLNKAAVAAGNPQNAGKWAVRNTRSAVAPLLTYATNRSLREKVWKTFYSRGDNGDKNDTNALIAKIVALRTEKAKMLGYESHAHLTLDPRMAKTPANALNLMMQVWPKAVARVNEEVADMQKLADAEGQKLSIEGWDYRYYAEKVRKAKYDLDSNEVRQYLQLEKLIEATHWMAGKIFGLTFTQVKDVPVFHPDVRVYKVTDATGKLVGLWYLDPYARDGKRSGAWMTDYRAQQNIDGSWITPIVSNNANFVKTNDGNPILITWDDATTLFHEFGHALHGLSSRVTYPSQAGTNVARDYVEFPSQLIEHWFPTKEVLTRFALHYKTGKPMPEALLKKIRNASTFNQGFDTVEYLSAALVDMKLHLATDAIDAKKFERDTLASLGMPKQIVMRHRMPQFLHLFSGGYSAGYYSYLWSDALTADAANLFEESTGGYYDQATAKSLVENIFSTGDTIDPAEGFRRFRGRDVDTKALLRKRGFPVH